MCTISLNPPTVVMSGSTIASITVSGTISPIGASGDCPCDLLEVTIRCGALPIAPLSPSTHNVPIVPSGGNTGTFSTTFSGTEINGCNCDAPITIVASCGQGQGSTTVTQTFTIDCNNDACDCLRVLNLPQELCVNQVPSPAITVANGCQPANIIVDFGDGSGIANLGLVGSTPVAVPAHSYAAVGTYTMVFIINGKRCPFSIKVKACDCCPEATAVVTSKVKEPCNPDYETKDVQVDALITPTPKPGCPTNIQAEMWIDGSLVASGSGTSPFTLSHQGAYKCGTHNVEIKYPVSKCPDDGGSFCVSVCEKPKCRIRRVNFEIAATIALISGILYAFNGAYTALGIVSASALVVAIIAFIRWIPCRKNCKKCLNLLVLWQIALATYLGVLILGKLTLLSIYTALSGSLSPFLAILIIILVLLLIALLIYLLYRNWVSQCCPTDCEKWTLIYEALLTICGTSWLLVAGIISFVYGVAVLNLFWLWYYTLIWAGLTYIAWIKKTLAC